MSANSTGGPVSKLASWIGRIISGLIILAMGAKRVEAVAEIRFASDQSCKVFDYVVVKDKGEVVDDLPNDAITLVHLPWVKECLIAGRLLEAPQW